MLSAYLPSPWATPRSCSSSPTAPRASATRVSSTARPGSAPCPRTPWFRPRGSWRAWRCPSYCCGDARSHEAPPPLALVTALAAAGCAGADLARTPPPLLLMEEPLELVDEPSDEGERGQLPRGSFTGVVVGDSRASLDALLEAPAGVLVTAVVENSPGAIAGVAEGDLLLEARSGETMPCAGPANGGASSWRPSPARRCTCCWTAPARSWRST